MNQAQDTGLDLNVALDAVFRRNARARPQAIALADPPDRSAFTDGSPRRLSYAGADAAVDRLARQLASLGLPPRAVVAVQLPNIVEAAIALLAIERAGLTAAPVPAAVALSAAAYGAFLVALGGLAAAPATPAASQAG